MNMLDTSKIDTTKVLMIHKIQLSFFINKYYLIRVPKNVDIMGNFYHF